MPELFVVEGPDAVGKHTQANMLAALLEKEGPFARVISFPRYDTPHGQIIKKLLHGELRLARSDEDPKDSFLPDTDSFRVLQALMSYDRYACKELVTDVGPLVLDRYWQSGVVYGSLDGLDTMELCAVHAGLPVASVAILLDMPPALQLERMRARGRVPDRYESDAKLLETAAAYYRQLWENIGPAMFPTTAWMIVDATGTAAEVNERIWDAVQRVRHIRATVGR